MAANALRTTLAEPLKRVRPGALCILAFLAGATQLVRLNIIGDVYLPELLLPFLALGAVAMRGGTRTFKAPLFWWLLLAGFVSLGGYMMSDWVRESSEAQYLRGWGKIVLMLSNFIALSVIFCADRRSLWWFVVGMGVGGVFYLRLVTNTPISIWKFGYGFPMMFAAAGGLAFVRPNLASLAFVGLGFVSIYYDSRLQGALCLFVAAVLWFRAKYPHRSMASMRGYWRVAAMGSVAGLVLLSALQFTADDYTSYRRADSNFGRSFGLQFGVRAIASSPVIGYGSWSISRELAAIQEEVVREKSNESRYAYLVTGSSMSAHSQILQTWIEGGILGVVFFAVLAWLGAKGLIRAALVRPLDVLTPFIVLLVLRMLWDLVASPYAAHTRLPIALGAAVLVVMAVEARARAAVARHQRSPASLSPGAGVPARGG